MFCFKKDIDIINRLHKRALRTIYDNFTLDREQLLQIDKSCSIHTKHLRTLMTEIYKSLRKENPQIMWDIFTNKYTHYDLGNKSLVVLSKVKYL